MQSTTLQDEMQPKSEKTDLALSEIDAACDMTVIKTNFKCREWIQTGETKARATEIYPGN